MYVEMPDTFKVVTFCENGNCTSRNYNSGNCAQKFIIKLNNYFPPNLNIRRKYARHRFPSFKN
jgi:aspartate carbamoyltransferase regulatory subunit